jgi:hypothetical protein
MDPSFLHITGRQLELAGAAIPAFAPALVAPGYVAAWLADYHGFRQRTMVGRLVWSIPLSLAISTIAADLIGRFLSLGAAAVFFALMTAVWLGLLIREAIHLRREGLRWPVGWRPYGTIALLLGLAWIAVALFSLVDWAAHQQLFLSVIVQDEGSRVNWTASVVRTGVPPANSLYFFHHADALRQYYFWYVLCAAVVRLWHLPVRAVYMASSVWAGFGLAALAGLYLQNFLGAGARLRRQFLIAVCLLFVAGLDLLSVAWVVFYLHHSPPLDFAWWARDQITTWMDSLLWVPHHVAGLTCCMFAFLQAWIAPVETMGRRAVRVLLIAAAMASGFGLSIFVAFGFFLLMVAWGIWQLGRRQGARPVALLAISGAVAAVLLSPYLWELMHTPSYLPGGSVFAFTVRQMIPPDSLLATAAFHSLAVRHPALAVHLANLVLLAPGYALELGFYLVVLLVFLVPAWRGRARLTPAQRTLVFLCVAALPMITFLRSAVLNTNDFGWRAALLLQFPLLLLGAQAVDAWTRKDDTATLPAPAWIRHVAFVAILLGIVGTEGQLLTLRFGLVLAERHLAAVHDPDAEKLSRMSFISIEGYRELDRRIPQDAVVQYDPAKANMFLTAMDQMYVNHQIAIAGDTDGCGSTLGGDPRGCATMAAALDPLFHAGDAAQARTVCRELGIQTLIARVYDPVWKDRGSWVWTLPPVVAQQQFRAVDCR